MEPYLEEVPDPADIDWIPCTESKRFVNTEIQQYLSCIAREENIFLVVNMGSIVWCKIENDATCPMDGRYQFNTNVVFDPNGKLIVRYRKHNLVDETPLFDPSPEAEFAIFDTPFGRFATIVCADLLFRQPTIELIESHGISNIILTSAWWNTPPFIMAIQMYEGFAKSFNVNLLVANCRHIEYSMAGSGIFTGQTIANYTKDNFDHDIGTLMTAKINYHPKTIKRSRIMPSLRHRKHFEDNASDETFPYKYQNGILFKYVILPETSHMADLKICYNGVCCFLEYSFKNRSEDEYFALGVASGPVNETIEAYLEICILRKCEGSHLESCNEDGIESAKTTFGSLTLRGEFSTKYMYPLVTTTPHKGGFDLAETEYDFSKHGSTIHSKGFSHPVLTVAILARNYEKDPGTNFLPIFPKMGYIESGADKLYATAFVSILLLII